MIAYPAKITKEDDMYLVEFLDFPNINTYGDTYEEALCHAKEALNGCITSDFERHFDIPDPSLTEGDHIADIPLLPHISFAIALRKKRAKQTQTEIAEKLGISYQAYQKLEHPEKCNPTLRTLEKLSEKLGWEIDIRIA